MKPMAATIEDLWPDDIRVDVRTPLQIMRVQEGLLGKKLRGVLEAEVASRFTDTLVRHEFDLIAPGLGGYRERIFSATHDRKRIYPVTVEAACFLRESELLANRVLRSMAPGPYVEPSDCKEAATEEDLIELIRQILHSPEVRSAIQSLVAQSNEVRGKSAPVDGTNSGGTPGSNPEA
jgi:hypothetical protein